MRRSFVVESNESAWTASSRPFEYEYRCTEYEYEYRCTEYEYEYRCTEYEYDLPDEPCVHHGRWAGFGSSHLCGRQSRRLTRNSFFPREMSFRHPSLALPALPLERPHHSPRSCLRNCSTR
jgi:hypothetical protein